MRESACVRECVRERVMRESFLRERECVYVSVCERGCVFGGESVCQREGVVDRECM